MIINIIQEIEKVINMKRKAIIAGVAVVVLLVVYFIAHRFYLKNIYNYDRVIENQLDSYYISEKAEELEPIFKLFQTYSFDDNIRSTVQKNTYSRVEEWYKYTTSKYICDNLNVNTCNIYLIELKNLIEKIRKIYIYREYEGYTILDKRDFDTIKNDYDRRVLEIEKITNDRSSTRGKNYEEQRKANCAKAYDCKSGNNNNDKGCKNGLCTCTYTTMDNKKETINCKESELNSGGF